MKLSSIQRICGISLIAGAALFFVYSVFWPLLLPVSQRVSDYSRLVLDPNWEWLASAALAGVLLMIFGFAGVYSRLYSSAGIIGLLGFILLELAYIFQACQITWEVFLYPVFAANSSFAALLRDRIIIDSPLVGIFRLLSRGSIIMGIIVFCFSLLRSKEYHKSAGILIFAGAIAYSLGGFISFYVAIAGIFVLSAGSVILGFKLMSKPAA